MRAALYTRVSTEEQVTKGFSLPAQEESLTSYVRSQGWVNAGVYSDEGYSGKDTNRPALQRLIADAERRAVDVVLVWKLDRLSRRQRDVLHLVEDVFQANGVGFRSVMESFDTTSPAGMAMLGLLAVFAQLERATNIERVHLGTQRRLREGKWSGKVAYGYRYNAQGSIEPDPDAARVVQRIFRDIVDGWGLKTIAQQLNTEGVPPPKHGQRWHQASLGIIAHNRAYIGEQRVSREWRPSTHERLIDEGVWHRSQAALRDRRKGEGGRPRRGESSRYLLSGLLICGACGSHMRGRSVVHRGRRTRYYTCPGSRRGTPCGIGYVRIEVLEGAVEADLLSRKVHRETPTPEPTEGADAERAAEVSERLARLVASVEEGLLTSAEVRERMDALRAESAEIEERRAASRMARSTQSERGRRQDLLERLPSLWPRATRAEQQAFLLAAVSRIVVEPGGAPRIYAR